MNVQPGIEAFSASLLKRLNKGVSPAQNVALLRYARSAGMLVHWNLLYGVPGDHLWEYEETLSLLPFLRHLSPPTGTGPIRLERFSPYVERPSDHGITRLRPAAVYSETFPAHADIAKLAYVFDGDYECASRSTPELVSKIEKLVKAWQEDWVLAAGKRRQPPTLWVTRVSGDLFLLRDTRGLPGMRSPRLLDREQASVSLAGSRTLATPAVEWALSQGLGAVLDGQYVPLATADPQLIREFETVARSLPL
jgi:hypothetical protein